MHHRRAAGQRDRRGQATFAGSGRDGAGHRRGTRGGVGESGLPVVVAQAPAERDEEDKRGDGGGGGGGVRQPQPQSGATNRNPTPRTVRR
ncbi:hypothetical protein GCM10010112_61740 [Actinoplanes lobatus]|nr:hypothetical protein GCM10010112_61740 [Actinoplanes lobatus]